MTMVEAQPVPLLSVSKLSVTFRSGTGTVTAVRSLSYDVRPGELLGIVGESGSGKSVSSLAIMSLLPPHAQVSGSVRLDGRELIGQSDAELSTIRGRRVAMVFQDPLSALTPVYTVGDQLAEALLVHDRMSRKAAWDRAVDLLALVGIPNPKQRATAFPHEFSGGMRQRVMIAMAIANNPALIIADEPTTALDVTIQAQILDVLQTARTVTGAAVILITQPRCHRRRGGPCRRDVRRHHRRNRYGGRCVLPVEDAVHARPPRIHSPRGRRGASAADAHRRDTSVAGGAAARLPLRAALPDASACLR